MTTPEKTACIIVAGGTGKRLGGTEPKQFRLLAGLPVLVWSVKFFANHHAIDELVIVVPEGWESRATELLSAVEVKVPITVIAGGIERQDSVLAGIAACPDATLVAVHDGARPFPPDNVEDGLAAARLSGGAIFALPATDSVKYVAIDVIERTIPRDNLWAAQTPQIFNRLKLKAALEECAARGLKITDDASAFEHMGWPVTIVKGSRLNIKITYPEDFLVAEGIIKGKQE